MITLTTDLGYEDHYVGVMKGVILKINPNTRIVDISHNVRKHDVRHASYILNAIIDYFENAVHVFVVDPGVGTGRKEIVAKLDKGYYVGPDNGILTLVEERVKEVYEINMKAKSKTFHGRDVFAPVAAHIASGNMKYLRKTDNFIRYQIQKPEKKGDKILGEIIHIDHFGNIITNIPQELVGNPKKILLYGMNLDFKETYAMGKKGELISLINSENLLEFAINKGEANRILNLNVGDKIEIMVE